MRSRSAWRVVLACSFTLAAGWLVSAQGRGASTPGPQAPQRPARDGASQPAGTGTISGNLTIAGSGAPARRARVTLSGADLRGTRVATADDEGRFSFAGLPAGRFTLSASRPGYVTVVYGQRQPGAGRPGTPIQLTDGQQINVRLQIPRGAVISGTVVDERGDTVPGTQVRAYRYTMQSGVRSLQPAGADATDDRGVYRIYGLQPGDYVIGATPRSQTMPPSLSVMTDGRGRGGAGRGGLEPPGGRVGGPRDGSEDTPAEGYAPVFYPGTTVVSSATSIEAGAGEERLGVDFQLQLVPMATVQGTVIVPGGGESTGVMVRLVPDGDDLPPGGGGGARMTRDGTFRFDGVAPGRYTVVALSSSGRAGGPPADGGGGRATSADRLWARTDISVDGRDLANVSLALQPGLTVSGRVDFRGLSTPPDPATVRVSLVPAATTAAARETSSPAVGTVDASGRFTIAGVVPGRYRMSASAGGGWSAVSAVVAGQDVMDVPLDVRPDQSLSGGVVTMSDQSSSLSGLVTNDQAQPLSDYTLIVFPSDSRFWLPQARRIRAVRPGTDGSFDVTGLPAGDYRVAPVLDPEPGAWYDPAFLQQIDAAAMSVTLGEHEKKVQNIRLAGA